MAAAVGSILVISLIVAAHLLHMHPFISGNNFPLLVYAVDCFACVVHAVELTMHQIRLPHTEAAASFIGDQCHGLDTHSQSSTGHLGLETWTIYNLNLNPTEPHASFSFCDFPY